MRGGRLRNKVTIESRAGGTRDANNELVGETWQPFVEAWAAVEPTSAREVERAKQFAEAASHKVTIRFVVGVRPTMRVRFGARVFGIDGIVNVDERNRELNLFCTEIVK